MTTAFYDVAVIGAGPAGLAAALAADKRGVKTIIIERDGNLGGILKQCIHDGFGLVRFGEKLTGPEYAHRFISKLPKSGIEIAKLTFVTKIKIRPYGFTLTVVNSNGINKIACKSIVFACGCRERSSRQIGIHGRHTAGILTAGTAQYYTNILGKMPAKRCIILGSGDIGLIMARRLKLEGASVLGVYEGKSSASGLLQNVYQCLDDYDIPLFTNKTVTRAFGEERLTAVEVSSVDDKMIPIPGTEEIIDCDTLIISVGLIPENELAGYLDIPIDKQTNGPIADQDCMTMHNGVFCCGNALHVNDQVDYVSESGETAGIAAAKWALKGWITAQENGIFHYADFIINDRLLYVVPQRLNLTNLCAPITIFFRSKYEMEKSMLIITLNGCEIFRRLYSHLRPPELEKLTVDFRLLNIVKGSKISISLSPVPNS